MHLVKAAAKKPSDYFYKNLEDLPFPAIIVDRADQMIIGLNKAACRFYSVDMTKFKKLTFQESDFFHIDPPLQASICGDSPGPFSSVQRLNDGKDHYLEIYKQIFQPASRHLCALFIFDNTEKKLLEDKLTRIDRKYKFQRSLFRTLLDTVVNPVFIRDADRKLISCNSAFEAFSGMNENHMAGRTISELFPDNFVSCFNGIDERITLDRGMKIEETILENSAGEKKNVIVAGNIFYDNKKKRAGYISVFTDITSFRKMENELKESLQKEKHLNNIKSRFLSTSSHEFRTPLTTILTSSELLAMVGRSWSEERYFDHIIKIQNAVTYMTGLLDDILTVDRTDRDVWRFNPYMINLYELCRKMLEEVSGQAQDTHKFSYEYLPGSKHAIVDEKLLQHILTNLLSNAVKYSPGGGEILLRVAQSLSDLEFIISDQGIGIPEEDRGNLFETFYRCRNSSKIKGTGLGLSIVKRSVEAHGGEIKFESRLNEGTTFRVLIPLMTSI